MTEYNQQYHAHQGKTIVDGYCEFHNCKHTGEVNFTGDYMYLCDWHRRVMNARNFMNSRKGTYGYKKSEAKALREKADAIDLELPALQEAAESAEFKYNLLIGRQSK